LKVESGKDDLLTVGAIAGLAFILADIAHEVIGHGVGLLAAGGRSGILTTTRSLPISLPETGVADCSIGSAGL
jgi:hypothetical protein